MSHAVFENSCQLFISLDGMTSQKAARLLCVIETATLNLAFAGGEFCMNQMHFRSSSNDSE